MTDYRRSQINREVQALRLGRMADRAFAIECSRLNLDAEHAEAAPLAAVITEILNRKD